MVKKQREDFKTERGVPQQPTAGYDKTRNAQSTSSRSHPEQQTSTPSHTFSLTTFTARLRLAGSVTSPLPAATTHTASATPPASSSLRARPLAAACTRAASSAVRKIAHQKNLALPSGPAATQAQQHQSHMHISASNAGCHDKQRLLFKNEQAGHVPAMLAHHDDVLGASTLLVAVLVEALLSSILELAVPSLE